MRVSPDLTVLGLSRIETKHLRWWQEITEGGSLLWHRPGKGVMHTAPDGLSRNPPGRDRLILAQQKDWIDFRARIQGLQRAIERGEADDEDPVALTLVRVCWVWPKQGVLLQRSQNCFYKGITGI